ncbi:4-hydroxybenzoate polyprenyl transferase [Suillus decipiens]|nr:4-hydroxybenzoate polyprenyl transferase [Suillus decipiens]
MEVKSMAIKQHLSPSSPGAKITWVDYFPSSIRPYLYLARVHNPAGTLLLFYPCSWSVTMACYAHGTPMSTIWTYVGLFLTAAQVFHSAGCVINDMWDKDVDAAVPRTRTRPLASGDVSMFQAFIFVIPQLALGVWLLMQLNEYSLRLGLSSLGLVVLYPAMKRVTDWPQAILGLCFNWGALLGAASVVGAVDWSVYIPLYMGAICWTIVYDTAYARQDRDEDAKYGVRSTTILFGDQIRPILAIFSFILCSFVTYAGYCNGHGLPFFCGVALGGLHLARLLARTDFESKEDCDATLLSNGWFGFWVWAGAFADFVVKTQL